MTTTHINYKMVRKSLLSPPRLKLKIILLKNFKTYGTAKERKEPMDFLSLTTFEAILKEATVFWDNTSLISLSLQQVWMRNNMHFSQRITTLKLIMRMQKFVNGTIGISM